MRRLAESVHGRREKVHGSVMEILAGIAGALLVALAAWDAFETVVLPRRVLRRGRFARFAQHTAWRLWRALGRGIAGKGRREDFLALFGPLTVIFLLGTWAAGMMVGFAMLQWGLGAQIGAQPGQPVDFFSLLYMSGTTFFTLGLGDLAPFSTAARLVTVVEVGMGFALLAMVVAYLPVLWQDFARREAPIVMLTMWAGSPSSAGRLLQRLGNEDSVGALPQFLQLWERWAAELLQTHLSYPVLAYYRSQHESQSWPTAMTTILDVCAFNLAYLRETTTWPARLTYNTAQRAAVDICQVLGLEPVAPVVDRLPEADLRRLGTILRAAGIQLKDDPDAARQITTLRGAYEPYANALALHLLADLPPWLPPEDTHDQGPALV